MPYKQVAADPAMVKQLTEELAAQVLGWKIAPNRFLKPGRSWIPTWKFQPFTKLADAFELLEQAADSYTLTSNGQTFTGEVCVGSRRGTASGLLKPEVISTAVARAIGIDVGPVG